MKKLFLFMIFIAAFSAVFSFEAAAEKSEYNDAFSLIGADELSDIIDQNAKNFFSEFDIDVSDYSWVNKLTAKNIIVRIFGIFKSGLKAPLKSGAVLLFAVIITASVMAFDRENGVTKALIIACILSASLIIVGDIWNCICAGVSAVKYISGFMLSFIPIFILSVSLSGATLSASASGGLLLFCSQAISYFASSFVLPVMGGYLSINLVASISPFESLNELAEAVKKAVIWILSLLFTVFVGIVGIQTAVNNAADTFALRTTKFIIGTCVPIAGGALSESANTIYASMNLLKSSVGIYGVVVVAIAVIPILSETLIWKGVLAVCASVSGVFEQKSLTSLLNSVNSLLTVLISIILFSSGLFIVSLGIVVSVARV